MIIADYHTHTKYSHGKNTIEENVQAAREKGLKEIAITDHGLNHVAFGLRPWKVREMRKIIDRINGETSDINVLLGTEANLISREGHIDVKPNQRDWFDVIVCGYHKVVWGKNLTETIKFIMKNDFLQMMDRDEGKELIKTNTEILKRAIQTNPIDIISHPNHDMIIDCVSVAEACRDYGTYFEINSKKVHVDQETLKQVIETGVDFVIDSDAHSKERVGDFELGLKVAEGASIPYSQIANWDKLPIFRSKGR